MLCEARTGPAFPGVGGRRGGETAGRVFGRGGTRDRSLAILGRFEGVGIRGGTTALARGATFTLMLFTPGEGAGVELDAIGDEVEVEEY